jgi:hypothetical protein
VVIESANTSTSLSACFYGLTGTINSSEVNETRHGGLVTRYAIRETRSWTELTHSGSSLIYSGS